MICHGYQVPIFQAYIVSETTRVAVSMIPKKNVGGWESEVENSVEMVPGGHKASVYPRSGEFPTGALWNYSLLSWLCNDLRWWYRKYGFCFALPWWQQMEVLHRLLGFTFHGGGGVVYGKGLLSLICSDHPIVMEMEDKHLHRCCEHASEDGHCQETVVWSLGETPGGIGT